MSPSQTLSPTRSTNSIELTSVMPVRVHSNNSMQDLNRINKDNHIHTHTNHENIESATATGSNIGDFPDPLGLRARIFTPSADDDKGSYFMLGSQERKKKLNSREVRKFYEEQNKQIAAYLKPTEKHAFDADDDAEKAKFRVKLAIYASLIANLCLAGLQLYAATSSLSLSFFATAADSVFDPFASFMLAYVHRKSQKLDPSKWPVGGARLGSIANICYSFLMITVNVILIVESIRSLVEGSPNETNELHIPSLVAVGVALATKFSLFCFCWTIKNSSSQVQILWEDHRNDLPVNSFGILTNAGGAKLRWWIDPMGAMIIATGVITSWTITGWQEFSTLIGKNADLDFQRFIVYKAMTFSDDFIAIDNIKAYTMGPELYVEVDVVMKPDTPLWQSHDLSQKFQDDLETLPGVGRAFVHVDHEVSHSAEHSKRK